MSEILTNDTPTHKLELFKMSVSATETFKKCPKKYYFQYIEKLPKKKWDHLDLGSFCHEVLEYFHENYIGQYGKQDRDYSKIVKQSWLKAKNSFPNMSEQDLLSAKEMITNYVQNIIDNGLSKVLGVEQEFELMIDENILLRGVIDRFDEMEDGRIHIVDYKTSKTDKYLDQMQLQVYGLWLKDKYPDLKEYKASYVMLRHNSFYKDYEFNVNDIDKIRKKLIAFATRIKSENQWLPVPSGLCKFCDFKEVCEAYVEDNLKW